jgi:hypothetical protein
MKVVSLVVKRIVKSVQVKICLINFFLEIVWNKEMFYRHRF